MYTKESIYNLIYVYPLDRFVISQIRFFDIHNYKAYEQGHEKMCLMSYANNRGADQPAHPRSLINAFVVRYLV